MKHSKKGLSSHHNKQDAKLKKREKREKKLDKALEDTFPASDATATY